MTKKKSEPSSKSQKSSDNPSAMSGGAMTTVAGLLVLLVGAFADRLERVLEPIRTIKFMGAFFGGLAQLMVEGAETWYLLVKKGTETFWWAIACILLVAWIGVLIEKKYRARKKRCE